MMHFTRDRPLLGKDGDSTPELSSLRPSGCPVSGRFRWHVIAGRPRPQADLMAARRKLALAPAAIMRSYCPTFDVSVAHWASGRNEMRKSWKKPKIVEVAVGMEINCYACADL